MRLSRHSGQGDDTRTINTLSSWVIAFAITAVGIVCIYGSEAWTPADSVLQSIVEKVGIALLIAGVLETIWELSRKRGFLREVREAWAKEDSVVAAGILGIENDLYLDVRWDDLFASCKRLEVAFAYGTTWRGQNLNRVRELVKTPKVSCKFLLPDPRCEQTIQALASLFDQRPDDIKNKVKDALRFALDLLPLSDLKSDVRVFVTTRQLTWSAYVFDHSAVWCMYTHASQEGSPPFFVLSEGGTLFRYVRAELHEFFNGTNPCEELTISSFDLDDWLEPAPPDSAS